MLERAKKLTFKNIQHHLLATEDDNFQRLKLLRQSGLFHKKDELNNLIDACEYLHDCGLDSGFLEQVAGADGIGGRLELMQKAHDNGWHKECDCVFGGTCDFIIVSLLLQKGMVKIVNSNKTN